MQQRFRRLALFVAASSLAAGGMVVIACGTDNGTSPTPTFPEAGGKDVATSETGPGNEAGPPDAGADCANAPVLHDYTNGFRCPFIDAGGREAGANCTNNETCCETSDLVSAGGAHQPSYCASGAKSGEATCVTQSVPNNSTFDAGSAWECADSKACTGGKICCMIQDPDRLAADPAKNKLNIGNTPASSKIAPACGAQQVYNEGGSRCKTPIGGNCEAGDIKLCSLSDQNCGAGTTCTPFIDFQSTHRGFCK